MVAALQLVALFASILYFYFTKRGGAIALPEDDVHDSHGTEPHASHDSQRSQEEGRASPHPREVEEF